MFYFLVTMVTNGRNIHIDQKGQDVPGCGSEDKPCLTLAQALHDAKSNDVLQISNKLPVETCFHDYQITKNLTIRGPTHAKSKTATIDCHGKSFRKPLFSVLSTSLSNVYFMLEDVQIRDLKSVAVFINSAVALIKHCQFIDIQHVFTVQDTLKIGNTARLEIRHSLFRNYSKAVSVLDAENISVIIQSSQLLGMITATRGTTIGIYEHSSRKTHRTSFRISVQHTIFARHTQAIYIENLLAKVGIIEISDTVFRHNIIGVLFRILMSQQPKVHASSHTYNIFMSIKHSIFFRNHARELIIAVKGDKKKRNFSCRVNVYNTTFDTLHSQGNSLNRIHTSAEGIENRISFVQCSFKFHEMLSTRRSELSMRYPGTFILSKGNFLLQHCSIYDNSSRIFKAILVLELNGNLQLRNVSIAGQAPLLNMNGKRVQLTNVTLHSLRVDDHAMDFMFVGTGRLTAENLLFRCPEGSTILVFSGKHDGGGYTNLLYYCRKCPPTTYTLLSGREMLNGDQNNTYNPNCNKCPYGATCKDQAVANPNYWGFRDTDKLHFKRCPNGYCLREGNSRVGACAKGRQGTLCGQCISGYSENLINSHCTLDVECNNSWISIVAFLFAVAYVLTFLYLQDILRVILRVLSPFRYLTEKSELKDSTVNGTENISLLLSLAKVVLYFYQLQFFIDIRGVPELDKTKYRLKQIISDASVFQPSAHLISGCPMKSLTPVTKKLFKSLFTIYLYLILSFIYIVVSAKARLTKTRVSQDFIARLYRGSVVLILLNFVALAKTSMTLLQCVHLIDQSVLFIDGHITCYQSWQYLVMAYILLFIVPVFPVLFIGVSRLHRKQISANQLVIGLAFPAYFFFCLAFYRNCSTSAPETANAVSYPEEPGATLRGTSPETTNHEYIQPNIDTLSSYTEFSDLVFSADDDLGAVESNADNADHASAADAVLHVLTKPYQKQDLTGPIYWESVLLVRRFLIIVFSAVIENLVVRLYAMLVFLSFTLIHHLYVQPFRYRCINRLETLSLIVLQILCAINLFFAHYIMDGEQPSEVNHSIAVVFDWILLVIAVAIPACLALAVVLALLSRVIHGLFNIGKAAINIPRRKWSSSQQESLMVLHPDQT